MIHDHPPLEGVEELAKAMLAKQGCDCDPAVEVEECCICGGALRARLIHADTCGLSRVIASRFN